MNFELEELLRLLGAILLGFFIGYERKLRMKEAGLRTHAIVCGGACLIMMISKYGFADVGGADGARIAAQIVSGIGFIGAGMILYKKEAIHGLTTAAGLWATAAVGMSMGAGLYILAAGSTIIFISVQYVLHIPCKLFMQKKYYVIRIIFANEIGALEKVKNIFNTSQFNSIKAYRGDNGLKYSACLQIFNCLSEEEIQEIMLKNNFIHSIERNEV